MDATPYSPEKFPMVRKVCEAFVVRQTAMHRHPVYRSSFGDISINTDCLASFLTSYFMSDDMTRQQVEQKFFKMLDIYNLDGPEFFASIGKSEKLKPEGVEVIADVLDYFSQKVVDGDIPAK